MLLWQPQPQLPAMTFFVRDSFGKGTARVNSRHPLKDILALMVTEKN